MADEELNIDGEEMVGAMENLLQQMSDIMEVADQCFDHDEDKELADETRDLKLQLHALQSYISDHREEAIEDAENMTAEDFKAMLEDDE